MDCREMDGKTAAVAVAHPRPKVSMDARGGERLMSIVEPSEMLGIPIETLYGWRHRGEGPVGYRVGRHLRYRRTRSRPGSKIESTAARARAGNYRHGSAAERQVALGPTKPQVHLFRRRRVSLRAPR